jgi:hypothetical protein
MKPVAVLALTALVLSNVTCLTVLQLDYGVLHCNGTAVLTEYPTGKCVIPQPSGWAIFSCLDGGAKVRRDQYSCSDCSCAVDSSDTFGTGNCTSFSWGHTSGSSQWVCASE